MTNKYDAPSGAPPEYATQNPPPAHLSSPAPSTDYYGASAHGSPFPPHASPYQHNLQPVQPYQTSNFAGSQQGFGGPVQHDYPPPQGGSWYGPQERGFQQQGGYYHQQQPMGYGPQPMYGQPGYYQPQGQYVDDRRGGMAGGGFMGALLGSMACCCCLELCLF